METRSRTPARSRPAGKAAASKSPTSPRRPRAASPAARAASLRAASPRPVAARKPTPTKAAAKDTTHGKAAPHFEFGGPAGALAITFGLPAVCYGLVRFCHPGGCLAVAPLSVPPPLPAGGAFTLAGVAAFVGWLALCATLHLVLPGAKVQGTVLRDGSRLTYKLNGMRVLAALMLLFGAATGSGLFRPAWVAANYLPLLGGGLLFSFLASAALYSHSFRPGKKVLLAAGGDTGSAAYDFFIGRELNPRAWGVDLKQWCELTPGLIGWGLLNICFCYCQWEWEGRVRLSMALVCLFQGIYIFDALACEPAILTTMDITTDGFGYMLVFGDLVWVPFTYSLQARYLLDHPVTLTPLHTVAILALQILGYAMFRGANSQKDAFRRDPTHPSVSHLRSLPTQRGTKLLISGWWGLSRHPNYLGDWLMSVAWCLPCGFASPVPWFYAIYFAVLLLHRAQRDDLECRKKYGQDWDKYIKLVPWRIVPGLY